MGFEIFIVCWRDGEQATIPRAWLRTLFPVEESGQETDIWTLAYDARNRCDLYLRTLPGDPEQITGFSVDRPCGEIRFWNALMDVLRRGNLVLYWPGEEPPLVADLAVIRHLPADMVESLGQPVCVRSGEEILLILGQQGEAE